jgi:hypothetical protein
MNEGKWRVTTADNVWPGDLLNHGRVGTLQVESCDHEEHVVWLRFLPKGGSLNGDVVMASFYNEDEVKVWR